MVSNVAAFRSYFFVYNMVFVTMTHYYLGIHRMINATTHVHIYVQCIYIYMYISYTCWFYEESQANLSFQDYAVTTDPRKC